MCSITMLLDFSLGLSGTRKFDLVVVVLRLLSQAVQVLVQGVDVVPVCDAVQGAVVEVRHLGVVFVDVVAEDVVDAVSACTSRRREGLI